MAEMHRRICIMYEENFMREWRKKFRKGRTDVYKEAGGHGRQSVASDDDKSTK